MLRLLVVSVSGVLISSLLPKPVPNWFTCVIFRARSQMKQSKSSFVVMASSIRWLLSPTLIFPMFSTVLVWPRTCRLQAASPAMVFVCGIKASFTSSRCAARLVIAFKTVLLVVSDIVAVSLGIWLASVPPFNRLLLPLPLIPFLLFLHATDSVSVSGADPSMSADEKENRISLTFPPMSLVPVLVTTSAQSCSHFCLGFQFQEACCFGFTSSVFSRDSRVFCWVLRRSPGQRAWWAAESIWFSFSLAVSVPSAAKSDFASAKSSVTMSVVSCFLKPVPASEKPVPVTAKSSGCLSTNWRVSRRSCSGYVVFECPDSQVFWDFGSLSRSIEEVYSTSFEYTIVSWNMFVVRFRGRKHLLCGVSLLFLKMLLTPCLLVGLLSSLDSNLFLSSIDPLLTYSTSSCCVNVFVASYFAYCLLVGEVRHVGELGGLVPPP